MKNIGGYFSFEQLAETENHFFLKNYVQIQGILLS